MNIRFSEVVVNFTEEEIIDYLQRNNYRSYIHNYVEKYSEWDLEERYKTGRQWSFNKVVVLWLRGFEKLNPLSEHIEYTRDIVFEKLIKASFKDMLLWTPTEQENDNVE